MPDLSPRTGVQEMPFDECFFAWVLPAQPPAPLPFVWIRGGVVRVIRPIVINPSGRLQRRNISDVIKIVVPNLPGPRVRLQSDPEHERKLARRRELYQAGGGKKKRRS